MAKFKPPKGIVNHAAVEECLSGPEQGFDYEHTEEGKQAAILHSKAMLGMV